MSIKARRGRRESCGAPEGDGVGAGRPAGSPAGDPAGRTGGELPTRRRGDGLELAVGHGVQGVGVDRRHAAQVAREGPAPVVARLVRHQDDGVRAEAVGHPERAEHVLPPAGGLEPQIAHALEDADALVVEDDLVDVAVRVPDRPEVPLAHDLAVVAHGARLVDDEHDVRLLGHGRDRRLDGLGHGLERDADLVAGLDAVGPDDRLALELQALVAVVPLIATHLAVAVALGELAAPGVGAGHELRPVEQEQGLAAHAVGIRDVVEAVTPTHRVHLVRRLGRRLDHLCAHRLPVPEGPEDQEEGEGDEGDGDEGGDEGVGAEGLGALGLGVGLDLLGHGFPDGCRGRPPKSSRTTRRDLKETLFYTMKTSFCQ